jgi:glutamyl-tRNA reductase
MTIRVFGINHETADISVREKVVVNQRQLPDVLRLLLAEEAVSEVIVLSTCNRTEIYFDAESAEVGCQFFQSYFSITDRDIEKYFYAYEGLEAIEHIMQVACGLNSMVLGEPEILGQMKTAVNVANEYQAIGTYFHKLFQKVFTIAKQVRSVTEIGVCPVSVASIAVKLAKRIFEDFHQTTVLLIGAGDTMKLVSKYLHKQGAAKIIVASRDIEKANAVADVCGGVGIRIGEIIKYLSEADIVMSATSSELPILGKGTVETALKKRKQKPIFMVDMAVPRDIEPQVQALENVYLYTIDDLKAIAEENVKVREHSADKAAQQIQFAAKAFLTWQDAQDSMTTIRSFREYVVDVQKIELEKAHKLLEQGADKKNVLERFAYNFTNKILHRPSVQIRQAGFEGRTDFLDMVQELFELDERDEKD